MIKAQDIMLALKLVAQGEQSWTQAGFASELGMSVSEVNAGLKRLQKSRLARRKDDRIVPVLSALQEFLVHGLKYVFPAQQGEMSRGMPAAYAAPAFADEILSVNEPPPVWPHADGDVRGMSFKPLYSSAPIAAANDPKMYTALAIVDVLRSGQARERALAEKKLKAFLHGL